MKLNAGLNRREEEVAKLIAWGGASKEVADKMKLSTRAIEATLRSIYNKVGIRKATELSVWWFVKHANVPIALDPWKRTIIATILLFIILPHELYPFGDAYRRGRARTRVQIERKLKD